MKTLVVAVVVVVAVFVLFAGLIWLLERDPLEALNSATLVVGGLVAVVAAAFLYFAPSIVAMQRQHPSTGGIMIVNLALGWTLVGWVVALAWAASGKSGQ